MVDLIIDVRTSFQGSEDLWRDGELGDLLSSLIDFLVTGNASSAR